MYLLLYFTDEHVFLIQVIYIYLIKIEDTTRILAHNYRKKQTVNKISHWRLDHYFLAKRVLNLLLLVFYLI